jgi:hypothetical protein
VMLRHVTDDPVRGVGLTVTRADGSGN